MTINLSLQNTPCLSGGYLRYRADIDGLRSLAILPVLLFHAGFSFFSGGFIGVDVFFVISGYLITSIIAADLAQRKFSIVDFYERRIRRIFPPLFAMFAVTFVVASWMLMPRDYAGFGRSLAAGTLFASNLMFWKEGGYFDTAAELKPLLHTWSLSIEEQFYMFFPLLLAIHHLKKRRTAILLTIFAASACAACFAVAYDHNSAFYLPFFRIWELMAGSVLALGFVKALPKQSVWNETGVVLGILLIFGSGVLYTSQTQFPGLAAVLPCLGAALIIHCGPSTRASAFLAAKPLVAIGKISYSLYLWHWPIIVFSKYYLMRDLLLPEKIAVVFASLLAAWLSYLYIETPFRQRKVGAKRSDLFAQASIASIFFAASGTAIYVSHGWPQRLPANVQAIAKAADDINPDAMHCDGKSGADISAGKVCTVGAPSAPPTFAILGDSFGNAFVPALHAAGAQGGEAGLVLTASGCYPLLGIIDELKPHDKQCPDFVRASIKLIKETPSITKVFLVSRWTSAAEGSRYGEAMTKEWFISDSRSTTLGYGENKKVFQRTLDTTLQALGRFDIYVLAHFPEQALNVPRSRGVCARMGLPCAPGVERSVFEQRQAFVRTVFNAMAEKQANIHILDVGIHMCDARYCNAMTGDMVLYSDDNHLSKSGALAIRSVVYPAFHALSDESGAHRPPGSHAMWAHASNSR